MSKSEILKSIRIVFSTSITKRNDDRAENNDYWTRRLKGFVTEKEFYKYAIKRGKKLLLGGQFIGIPSDDRTLPNNNYVYTTIDSISESKYIRVFSKIAKLQEVQSLYYLKVIPKSHSTMDFTARSIGYTRTGNKKRIDVSRKILVPDIAYFRFEKSKETFISVKQSIAENEITLGLRKKSRARRGTLEKKSIFKNAFKNFSLVELELLYATRFFLDIFLGAYSKEILDLDYFLIEKNGLAMCEVKGKSPFEKNGEEYFGWDTRRIFWYSMLSNRLGMPVRYVIKRTDKNRWLATNLDTFIDCTSWGWDQGGGGGSSTMTAPIKIFRNF